MDFFGNLRSALDSVSQTFEEAIRGSPLTEAEREKRRKKKDDDIHEDEMRRATFVPPRRDGSNRGEDTISSPVSSSSSSPSSSFSSSPVVSSVSSPTSNAMMSRSKRVGLGGAVVRKSSSGSSLASSNHEEEGDMGSERGTEKRVAEEMTSGVEVERRDRSPLAVREKDKGSETEKKSVTVSEFTRSLVASSKLPAGSSPSHRSEEAKNRKASRESSSSDLSGGSESASPGRELSSAFVSDPLLASSQPRNHETCSVGDMEILGDAGESPSIEVLPLNLPSPSDCFHEDENLVVQGMEIDSVDGGLMCTEEESVPPPHESTFCHVDHEVSPDLVVESFEPRDISTKNFEEVDDDSFVESSHVESSGEKIEKLDEESIDISVVQVPQHSDDEVDENVEDEDDEMSRFRSEEHLDKILVENCDEAMIEKVESMSDEISLGQSIEQSMELTDEDTEGKLECAPESNLYPADLPTQDDWMLYHNNHSDDDRLSSCDLEVLESEKIEVEEIATVECRSCETEFTDHVVNEDDHLKLTSETTPSQELNGNLERDIAAATEEVSVQNSELQRRLNRREEQLEILSVRVADLEQENQRLEVENAEMLEKNLEILDLLDQNAIDLECLRSDNSKKESENKELRERLQKLEKKVSDIERSELQLRSALEEERGKREQITVASNATSQELAARLKEIGSLKQTISQLEASLEAERRTSQDLNVRIDDMVRNRVSSEKTIEERCRFSFEEERRDMMKETEIVREQLRVALVTHRSEMERATQEFLLKETALKGDVKRLREEISRMEQRSSSSVLDIATATAPLVQERDNLRAEVITLQQRLRIMQDSSFEMDENSRESMSVLQAEKLALRESLDSTIAVNESLQQRIVESEKMVEEWQLECKQLKDCVHSLESKQLELQKHIESLTIEKDEAIESLSSIRNDRKQQYLNLYGTETVPDDRSFPSSGVLFDRSGLKEEHSSVDGFHSVVSASLNRSSNSTSPRAARSLLLDLSRVHNRDSPSFASEKEYRARRQSTDSPSIAETLIQSLAYANDSSIPSSPSSFNSSLLGGRPPLLEDVGKLDLGHPSTSSSQNLSIRIQELEELQRSLSDEIFALTTQNQELEKRLSQVSFFEERHQEIQRELEFALVVIGEKEDRIEELEADIRELRLTFRQQMDALARFQQSR